jgi:hypothetical protein
MVASLFTTVFFSLSVFFAARSSRILGGPTANLSRLILAMLLLAIWAHGFGGAGFGGGGGGGGAAVVFSQRRDRVWAG